MKWYLKCLAQYFDFSGRARRKEYWMFYLFNIIFSFVIGIIDGLAGTGTEMGMGVLSCIYTLAVLIPGLAVGVRRLHDIGKSGWNLLFGLIPIVGAILLLIWFCSEGDAVANQYGEPVKN